MTLFPMQNIQFVYSNWMARVRANQLTLPKYLFMACVIEAALQYLQFHGTALQWNRPGIDQLILMPASLSAPRRARRDEIVSSVESLYALVDSIDSRLAEATALVKRTTQAIVVQAFRGEL